MGRIPKKNLKNWRWWAALTVQVPIYLTALVLQGGLAALSWAHDVVWRWVNKEYHHD